MARITTIDCPKILLSPLDTSKTTLAGLANPGCLANAGVTFFGGAISLGVAKAAVNIGPPIAIPPLSMPFSLWVDGISVFMGVTNFVGARFSFAFVQDNGFHQKNGASNSNGASVKNAIKIANTIEITNGLAQENGVASTAGVTVSPINTCFAMKNKSFDIPHPNKEGHRLRHVCVEGPESAVYIRGRLTGKSMIELPEYWNGLVDYDSITVQLQPIGDRHFHLNVKEMDKEKVVVKEADDKPIDCFYHIWANRIGPELHVEYKGESPADYPGDQSEHSVAGYHYDRRED